MTLLRFGPQPNNPTGHLIQVNAEAFRLEAGLARAIFLMPIGIYKYMTMSWFTKTWYHCKLLQIEITMEVKDFVLPRQGDVELMQILLKHGLQGHKLACMKHCCMFLNANYLSDICMGDGTAINPQYWDSKTKCVSDYIWPRMEKPPAQDWNQWRKNLTVALALGWKETLQKPLGHWAHH